MTKVPCIGSANEQPSWLGGESWFSEPSVQSTGRGGLGGMGVGRGGGLHVRAGRTVRSDEDKCRASLAPDAGPPERACKSNRAEFGCLSVPEVPLEDDDVPCRRSASSNFAGLQRCPCASRSTAT
jgi:hypothetical protein